MEVEEIPRKYRILRLAPFPPAILAPFQSAVTEIAIAIQKTLNSLNRMSSSGLEAPIADTAARCIERAQERLKFEPDKRRAAEHAFVAQEQDY